MVLAALFGSALTAAEEQLIAAVILEGAALSTLPLGSELRDALAPTLLALQQLPVSWQLELSEAVLRGASL